ncbi:unnamed protein product [Polarella glacialis]|uniref:Inosine/uridine-preferring nucleoside hydrolase domain-containing protein n=1 Tax=Polarella glacialis TaxID=89957 RepID=A0A813ECX5_POLGL|nr:unnamed protein product [Polarella glacialis]
MGGLMYLLSAGRTPIGISVAGDGWSNQYAGVVNVQRILQKAACGATNVAYGQIPYTVLSNDGFSGQHGAGLPPQTYLDGIDFALASNCSSSPWPVLPAFPYPFGAAKLIVDTVKASDTPVDMLLLGPFTNLARALSLEPGILNRIGTLYVSGGKFAEAILVPEDMESTASGFYMSNTEPRKNGGQNFFLDAIATSMVFGAVQRCQAAQQRDCPEIEIMSSDAQHMLQGSPPEEIEALCAGKCTGEFSAKVEAYFKAISPCGGQPISAIYYWDESAAAMAAGKANEFCSEWAEEKFVINLDNGPLYSAGIHDPINGVAARICKKANRSRFIDIFWEPIRQNDAAHLCPVNSNEEGLASRLYKDATVDVAADVGLRKAFLPGTIFFSVAVVVALACLVRHKLPGVQQTELLQQSVEPDLE